MKAPESSWSVDAGRVSRVTVRVDDGTPIPMRLHWRILRAVRAGVGVPQEIASRLGAPRSLVRVQLRSLRRAGLIRWDGNRWTPVKGRAP